jgi:quaternary ammonium compound-resistance protein SugE
MNWIFLFAASFFEILMTFTLGKTKDATGTMAYVWWPAFLSSSFFSMYFLSRAVKTIPLGTAYPVWTGIGAVGTVLIGIIVFKEPATFWRMFFISTLVISIVGLKMV